MWDVSKVMRKRHCNTLAKFCQNMWDGAKVNAKRHFNSLVKFRLDMWTGLVKQLSIVWQNSRKC